MALPMKEAVPKPRVINDQLREYRERNDDENRDANLLPCESTSGSCSEDNRILNKVQKNTGNNELKDPNFGIEMHGGIVTLRYELQRPPRGGLCVLHDEA